MWAEHTTGSRGGNRQGAEAAEGLANRRSPLGPHALPPTAFHCHPSSDPPVLVIGYKPNRSSRTAIIEALPSNSCPSDCVRLHSNSHDYLVI